MWRFRRLSKQKATIDNVALQDTINKSKGLMAKSSSTQDTCNSLNLSQSACAYLQDNQCCVNSVAQQADNEISAAKGCPMFTDIFNVQQKVGQRSLAECQMASSTTISTDMASKIFNQTTQSAQNSSEGITVAFLVVILLIIAVILFAPVIAVSVVGGKALKAIYTALGPILMIAGVVCLIIFAVNGKPEQIEPDRVFRADEDRDDCLTGVHKQRSTYGDALQKLRSKSDYGAMTFFTDAGSWPADRTEQPTSSATGLAVFYSPDCAGKMDTQPVDKPAAMFPVCAHKSTYNLLLAITGGLLIVAGVVVLTIGILARRRRQTP